MTRTSAAGSILCTLATGAAMMYLLDPSSGRSRRSLVADKTRWLGRRAKDASSTLSRSVSTMRGWSPTTRALVGTGAVTGVAAATYAISRARRTVADAATDGMQLGLIEEGWAAQPF